MKQPHQSALAASFLLATYTVKRPCSTSALLKWATSFHRKKNQTDITAFWPCYLLIWKLTVVIILKLPPFFVYFLSPPACAVLQLNTLRGSILEDAVPSTSKHGLARGLPLKEVLEYLVPELNVHCLRLAINTPKVTDQLMKLDEQGVSLGTFWEYLSVFGLRDFDDKQRFAQNAGFSYLNEPFNQSGVPVIEKQENIKTRIVRLSKWHQNNFALIFLIIHLKSLIFH